VYFPQKQELFYLSSPDAIPSHPGSISHPGVELCLNMGEKTKVSGALGHVLDLHMLHQKTRVLYPPACTDLLHALRSPKQHEMPTLRSLNCSRDITEFELCHLCP